MTRLTSALQGSLQQHMKAEAAIVAQASRRGTKATTEEVKAAIRRRVAAALSGGRRGGKVANSIRSRVYHDGPGKDAGLVWSKFGRGRGAQFVDYLLPHVGGALVKAKSGKFLFIPQVSRREAKRARNSRRVAFIPWKGGLLMVRHQGRQGGFKVLAVLVRQVRMKARIYLDDMPEIALRTLTAEVLDDMAKQK